MLISGNRSIIKMPTVQFRISDDKDSEKKSLLRDTVPQTFRWESVADSPRAVWNLSSGNTFFSRFFPDIKKYKL